MQTPGRIGIGHLRYPAQLPGGYLAVGKFYPHHLNTFLPLPVDPTGQPEASELLLIELSVPELLYLSFEFNDIPGNDGVFQFCPKALHSIRFYLLTKQVFINYFSSICH